MSLAEVSLDGAVATLTLNRPQARNALSTQVCEDIIVAMHGLEAEAVTRSVLIRGEGPAFCAGADFAAVSGNGGADFLPTFERMLETVARCRFPTVACIHGAALGGGLQLATACDFRLAADDAKLGIPSAKLGILVNFENVQRLVLTAGARVAKEVLMTGRTYTGEQAAAMGLVNASFPAPDLAGAAEEMTAELAALAPLSVQGVKRSIQAVLDHLGGARSSAPDVIAEIDRLVTEAYESDDLQEGIEAMSEKRPPRFTGT